MDDLACVWIHFSDDLVCFAPANVPIHFKLQHPPVEGIGVPISDDDGVVHIVNDPFSAWRMRGLEQKRYFCYDPSGVRFILTFMSQLAIPQGIQGPRGTHRTSEQSCQQKLPHEPIRDTLIPCIRCVGVDSVRLPY
jgi:hypothetical protein